MTEQPKIPDIAAKIAAARSMEAAATPSPWCATRFLDVHGADNVPVAFNDGSGAFLRAEDASLAIHARNHHAVLWDVVEAAQGVACHCNPPHIACGASEGMECECGAADFGAALNAMRAALAKLVEAQ